MATRKKASPFTRSSSQAVRIPCESQRQGDTLVIRQSRQTWQPLTDGLSLLMQQLLSITVPSPGAWRMPHVLHAQSLKVLCLGCRH